MSELLRSFKAVSSAPTGLHRATAYPRLAPLRQAQGRLSGCNLSPLRGFLQLRPCAEQIRLEVIASVALSFPSPRLPLAACTCQRGSVRRSPRLRAYGTSNLEFHTLCDRCPMQCDSLRL